MAPLYTAAALGYASVRWLKAFSEEQCAGINRFVATYALPALIFDMVSTNDPYAMNARLVAADTLQKGVMLLGLVAWAAWSSLRRRGTSAGNGKVAASPLQWVVTAFSMTQLPSTIIMGVPILGALYGPTSKDLMKQIVVMQLCVWYNVIIFMYEYMAAMDGSNKVGPAPASPENVGSTEVAAAQPGMAVASQTTSTAVVGEVTPTHGADAEVAQAEDLALPAPPSMSHVAFVTGKKVLKIPNTYAAFLSE
ncbi:probable auxin efflux carrier component 9 [Triticum dicoccoides]|uniref:probable auxin efflux carrier component 9 n=1 Tax=Triticum dicoccoides TaxID=85692 RepID=UPI0018915246|nr:probable auxin efflux carrier component 9 [Triticum dicoccoides]